MVLPEHKFPKQEIEDFQRTRQLENPLGANFYQVPRQPLELTWQDQLATSSLVEVRSPRSQSEVRNSSESKVRSPSPKSSVLIKFSSILP